MVIKINIMVLFYVYTVYQTSAPYKNKKNCIIKLNNKKDNVSYITLSLN